MSHSNIFFWLVSYATKRTNARTRFAAAAPLGHTKGVILLLIVLTFYLVSNYWC